MNREIADSPLEFLSRLASHPAFCYVADRHERHRWLARQTHNVTMPPNGLSDRLSSVNQIHRWRYWTELAILTAGAALAGMSASLAYEVEEKHSLLRGFLILAGLVLVGGVAFRALSSGRKIWTAATEARFQIAAANVVAAVEGALPPAQPSLDQEIEDVTRTLADAVARLAEISRKAEAYGEEVRHLVAKAEQAKAAVELNETAARKIAQVLGREADSTLRREMAKLTEMHVRELSGLRRSGNRAAWITFVAGAAVGFVTNIVTSFLMR